MPNMNIMSGKFLSDMIGAHDLSDFVMQVYPVSADSLALLRGSVVCRKADGAMTLAGAESTGPNDVFGISLEPMIAEGGGVASVARSGVYDATQLLVDPGVSLADFADRLREIGIFLEKLPMVGIIPVPGMGAVEPIEATEQPLNPS